MTLRRYHIFNRIDDEVLALMGLLDVLEQQLTDTARGKRKTRVPQDVHQRFMLACLVVLQDGVQLAGASIYICQRGLASPGDLQFGSHGASAADAPQFPLSRRAALRPMTDFVRRDFEARGAPVGLGEGVCLVDLQATESESMDFLYNGPGRGGLCKCDSLYN